jgi:hypothetical protein
MFVEERNDTALGRNVETTKALIKGEHVGIVANRINRTSINVRRERVPGDPERLILFASGIAGDE